MPKSKSSIARRITQFNPYEIRNLARNANTISNNLGLTIKAASFNKLKENNDAIARILIVTPKRVGCAPKRNKIKRQIRSIFYKNKLYNLKYNFMAYCHKPITKLSYTCLEDIITSAINKLK